MLVDVHCHLDKLPEIDQAIKRAKENKVVAIITNGLNEKTNRESLKLADKYDIVEAALGLYPTDALKLDEEQISSELDFIKKNREKIIAIGEVGIDLFHNNNLKKQEKIFLDLISLSEKIKKPLIVHSRKAEQQVIDLLISSNVKKIILHCFGGNKKLIQKAYDQRFFFSIPPSIVRSEHFQLIVDKIPLSNILTETDSPYQSPFKDRLNEPSNVIETIKKISEIKKLQNDETEKIIYMNYKKFFI